MTSSFAAVEPGALLTAIQIPTAPGVTVVLARIRIESAAGRAEVACCAFIDRDETDTRVLSANNETLVAARCWLAVVDGALRVHVRSRGLALLVRVIDVKCIETPDPSQLMVPIATGGLQ